MSFPYPPKPWSDGDKVQQLQSDGTVITATYNLVDNVWNMVRTNPDTASAFVTDQQVLITPREDSIRSKLGSLYVESTEPNIATQYDVNNTFAQTDVLSAKNTARTSDLIDFTNNSVCQAYWVHTQVDSDPYPDIAEFWAYDENGVETTQFLDIRKIIFNDNGIVANPGTENVLENVRVGDYLIMQEVDQNHFGMYVIADKTVYQGNIREFSVKLFKNARGFGDCQYSAHCSVRVTRPEVVVVQNEQPFVSARGVLWYRESDDHLFISNYADGYVGEGPQWTDLTAGGAGGGDYLPLTGGDLTGKLNINVGSGEALTINTNKVKFWSSGAVELTSSYTNFKDNELITKAYVGNNFLPLSGGTNHKMTGNLYLGGNKIAGVASPELSTDAATKEYVDAQVSTGGKVPGIANYKWVENRTLFNLRPGEITGTDFDGNQTSIVEEIKALVWHGVDADGNRPSGDMNSISFNSFFSTATLMNPELTQTFLRAVGGSHLGKDYGIFQYSKEYDTYFIGWDAAETATRTSEMVRFLPDQLMTLRIPDWFI